MLTEINQQPNPLHADAPPPALRIAAAEASELQQQQQLSGDPAESSCILHGSHRPMLLRRPIRSSAYPLLGGFRREAGSWESDGLGG